MGAARPGAFAWSAAGFRPSRGGQAIFHFAGIDSVEAAEPLRGLEVQVPLEQRAKLDAGNYYVGDLVGCEVWEAGASAALGAVRDVEFPGGVPLLVGGDRATEKCSCRWLRSFAFASTCKAKRIDVALPEGLRDLNRG